jgi:hypothetical protein
VSWYVVVAILICAMFVCAVIALVRARREDIPAVVEALGRWWWRKWP